MILLGLFKTFADIDKNNDGTIVLEELGYLFRTLGQNPTDAELQKIMDEADLDSKYIFIDCVVKGSVTVRGGGCRHVYALI